MRQVVLVARDASDRRPRGDTAASGARRRSREKHSQATLDSVGLEMPAFALRALPPVTETPHCACGKMVDLQQA
jgi:hypothetical protein